MLMHLVLIFSAIFSHKSSLFTLNAGAQTDSIYTPIKSFYSKCWRMDDAQTDIDCCHTEMLTTTLLFV